MNNNNDGSNSGISGIHLIMDCTHCNQDKMENIAHIQNVLSELVDMLNMTAIAPPYVFPYCGKVPEDKGVTGIVIIAESHITIHTFTEKDCMFCDIFSCIPFETEKAIDYIVNHFNVKEYSKTIVKRNSGHCER